MPHYPLADSELARRIEQADSDDLCGWVRDARDRGIYPDAACLKVGGGVAVWFSAGNVVNSAFGLGMAGEVEPEEVASLIAFYSERGMAPRVDVCPHADKSLLRWLATAAFVATDFETVLYQPLPAPSPSRLPSMWPAGLAPGVEVRIAHTAEARAVWADLEARGFTDEKATSEHHVLATSIAVREGALPFIGYLDGKPAGTGMLTLVNGIAMFNGDSTLPWARNRGVQSSILAERLRYASESDCELGVIEAAPGGVSQRNQLRAGFRVAYTRVTFELPSKMAEHDGI